MADEIMRAEYTAADGQEVHLTPADVMRYVVAPGTGVTDQEMARFLGICKARSLNPLAGDCHLVKYGDSPASVIVGKDYFVRTAAEQPGFDGYEAGVVVARGGGVEYREGSMVLPGEQLVGGWATVYDKRRAHPVRSAVSLAEYTTGRSMWRSKPATMIRKVALVQALREGYPERFAGAYDGSEMGAAGEAARAAPQPVPAEVVYDFPDAPQGRGGAEIQADEVVQAPECPQPAQEPPAATQAAQEVPAALRQALADMARAAAQACGAPEADARRAVWAAVRGADMADQRAVCALAMGAARKFREQRAAVPAAATEGGEAA